MIYVDISYFLLIRRLLNGTVGALRTVLSREGKCVGSLTHEAERSDEEVSGRKTGNPA